jgi:hydrogenase maturation protease
VHLVFGALLEADSATSVTGDARKTVVVGLGNSYRRDDGVGVAVAQALDGLAVPNVCVISGVAEPMSLLEAWSGAGLAVVIDAAIVVPSTPGRVRRCTLRDVATAAQRLSSHSIDIGRTHALGEALGRVPDALVLFTVEIADASYGIGLTPQVARAVPEVVGMVVAEINGPAVSARRSASR